MRLTESFMDIKEVKSKSGKTLYEVDGISFAARELAEEHVNSEEGHKYDVTGEPEYIIDDDDATAPSFKRFIASVIFKKQMSLLALAKSLEVSRQTLYSWIEGSTMPERKHVERVARVLGVSEKAVWQALRDNLTAK